jgi:hypothetical protein
LSVACIVRHCDPSTHVRQDRGREQCCHLYDIRPWKRYRADVRGWLIQVSRTILAPSLVRVGLLSAVSRNMRIVACDVTMPPHRRRSGHLSSYTLSQQIVEMRYCKSLEHFGKDGNDVFGGEAIRFTQDIDFHAKYLIMVFGNSAGSPWRQSMPQYCSAACCSSTLLPETNQPDHLLRCFRFGLLSLMKLNFQVKLPRFKLGGYFP